MPKKINKKTSYEKSQKTKLITRQLSKGKKTDPPKQTASDSAIKFKNPVKLSTHAHRWFGKYAHRVSFFGGVFIVSLWTVVRHISNGVNFDVVGQIGVAQQWSHGQMSGAELGATSYLLKMPVYFVINALHFLSPMNRLLLAALIFNIATFILLFIIYKKIMKLYQIKNRSWLYAVMFWLATIAGNVYWVDYANSRNLETVGGILFIYLVLKYLKDNRLKILAVLGITGGIVFFADPIQLYVCGLGVCLFAFTRLIIRPSKARAIQALGISVAVALGYGFSQALFFLARRILHVTFLVAPNIRPKFSASYVVNTLHGLGINTLKIFGADFIKRPYNLNSVRVAINAVILSLLLIFLIKVAINKRRNMAFSLALVVIIVNYLVYLASGQVSQWETSRYLIMVPLLLIIIVIIAINDISLKNRIKFQNLCWLASAVSAVILIGGLAFNWPNRHSKDIHIYSLVSFMNQHKFKYALTSRESGITTTYFSQGNSTELPMSCQSDHALHPTNLFYDKAAFDGIYHTKQNIPIIIPPGGIKFGDNTCTGNNIFGQFGAPKKIVDVSNVGLAAVYPASRIRSFANLGELTGQPSSLKSKKTALKPDKTKILTPVSTIPKLKGCTNGTDDIVVAHPDDDILFMNPDLSNDLADKCVRTVYVTAGDDGRSQDYWINRQHGIESSYASMVGLPNDWNDDVGVIEGHSFLVRTLNSRPSLGLIFLLLPDGGVDGRGFPETSNSSLEQLSLNATLSFHTVDGTSSYTYSELAKVVGTIIATDEPNKIYTHVADGPLSIGDHSDHRAVGLLTIHSRTLAKSNATLVQYVGYPVNSLPPNLPPEVAVQKRNIFDIYASQDAVICVTTSGCSIEDTFGRYFSRSYRIDKL